MKQELTIKDFVVEHQKNPLGIDCAEPRFGWKLVSERQNVYQKAYQMKVYTECGLKKDTGKIESQESIECIIENWKTRPMEKWRMPRYRLSQHSVSDGCPL